MPFSSTVIMMGCSLAICLSSRMSRGLQNLRSASILSDTRLRPQLCFNVVRTSTAASTVLTSHVRRSMDASLFL